MWWSGNVNFSQPVEDILKSKKITDYLSDKGILPSRSFTDKTIYLCPLHTSDKIPSFTVYENEDKGYETYYCWGCKSGGSVIQLQSALENIPVREIMKDFSKEFRIDNLTALDIACRELNEILDYHPIQDDSLLFKISSLCYMFLREVSFDKKEFDFLDSILEKIDQVIKNKDKDTLEKIYNFLSDKAFKHRCQQFNKRKEEELKEAEKEREIWENV
jgi:hypothetical protein